MRKINLAYCALALGLISGYAEAVSQGTVTFNGKLLKPVKSTQAMLIKLSLYLPFLRRRLPKREMKQVALSLLLKRSIALPPLLK